MDHFALLLDKSAYVSLRRGFEQAQVGIYGNGKGLTLGLEVIGRKRTCYTGSDTTRDVRIAYAGFQLARLSVHSPDLPAPLDTSAYYNSILAIVNRHYSGNSCLTEYDWFKASFKAGTETKDNAILDALHRLDPSDLSLLLKSSRQLPYAVDTILLNQHLERQGVTLELHLSNPALVLLERLCKDYDELRRNVIFTMNGELDSMQKSLDVLGNALYGKDQETIVQAVRQCQKFLPSLYPSFGESTYTTLAPALQQIAAVAQVHDHSAVAAPSASLERNPPPRNTFFSSFFRR